MSTPEVDLKRLQTVAEAARSEPWMELWWRNDAARWIASVAGVVEVGDHMAAFDPPTTLALLGELAALRGQVAAVRELVANARRHSGGPYTAVVDALSIDRVLGGESGRNDIRPNVTSPASRPRGDR